MSAIAVASSASSGSFSVTQDGTPTTSDGTPMRGVVAGNSFTCGVAGTDLLCAYTGGPLTTSSHVAVFHSQQDFPGQSNAYVLPTCYNNVEPLSDATILALDPLDRNLALSYIAVKLDSNGEPSPYLDSEVEMSGFRSPSEWHKARSLEECESLLGGQSPASSGLTPAHMRFTPNGANTEYGACYLAEGVRPPITDGSEEVKFSNIMCFNGGDLGSTSPAGQYLTKATDAATQIKL